MTTRILCLNGPNLNLLGLRPSQHYGQISLTELEQSLVQEADSLGIDLTCKQSNHEGQLLDWLHASLHDGTQGLMINAGAYTHTSLAIGDALEVLTYPIIEVHLSQVYAREPIRHHSYVAAHSKGQITGLGPLGYHLALQALKHLID